MDIQAGVMVEACDMVIQIGSDQCEGVLEKVKGVGKQFGLIE